MNGLATSEGPKPHSVKVPRLYKVASSILKDYDEGKDSIKNLVFNCKKHPNTKALFALVMETANHSKQIDEVTKKIQLFENEPRFNRHLAFVLINELIWGKETLPGESVPVQTVRKYKKKLKKNIDLSSSRDLRALDATWPRYARVNTLCNSVHRVARALREEGWLEVMYDRTEVTSLGFLELVSGLAEGQYLADLHIPNLLVFPPKTPLYDHALVRDGSLLLQDKSSCFPVTALAPPPGSCALDACSAPGMKTSQLAAAVCGDWVAALGGQPPPGARVIAVERSSKRFGVLTEMLEKTKADSVTTALNSDFLDISPSQHPEVEYIVLDPSCSGTGMAKRGGGEAEPSEERLKKLSSLQFKLLRHALQFPRVKRVVYSTCAVSEEENEKVVARVLVNSAGWRVVNILPSWSRRGLDVDTFPGDKYVRADSEKDSCNGFFVAVLERDVNAPIVKVNAPNVKAEEVEVVAEDDAVNAHDVKWQKKKKKTKDSDLKVKEERVLNDTEAVNGVVTADNGTIEAEPFQRVKKKKREKENLEIGEEPPTKKKKKKEIESNDQEESNVGVIETEIPLKMKKKKKRKEEEVETVNKADESITEEVSAESHKKKKKKDKKKEVEAVIDDVVPSVEKKKKKKKTKTET